MLMLNFVFSVSLLQGTMADNLSSQPTPTPTSTTTPSLNPTPNSTATPETTYSQVGNASEFGYATVGKKSSDMPTAKTITLCNYTTPPLLGTIVQISLYLTGISEGSNVRAVIFANEPTANFPQGGEPIAQSFGTLNVTSLSGQWYNFTINYPFSPNTIYWLGYYADNPTHCFVDASNNSITVTSQPKDGTSNWLPVGWTYEGKTIMSLYATCTLANPKATVSTQVSAINGSILGYWDAFFMLSIIGGETAIVVTGQARKKTSK
jgi:hypothetical protein